MLKKVVITKLLILTVRKRWAAFARMLSCKLKWGDYALNQFLTEVIIWLYMRKMEEECFLDLQVGNLVGLLLKVIGCWQTQDIKVKFFNLLFLFTLIHCCLYLSPDVSATVATSSYPIGTYLWQLYGNHGCLSDPEKMHLTMTTCNESQYTCDNGICINIEARYKILSILYILCDCDLIMSSQSPKKFESLVLVIPKILNP